MNLRAQKIAGIAADIPDLEVHGKSGDLLVLGWGSTFGAIRQAVDIELQGAGALWKHCTPGDIVRLTLPEPYLLDGYDGPVAIIDTEVVEETGTMRLNVEVPS